MAGTVICDYINSANVSGGFFGIGQTWQNVTSSRSADVTYTNTTGKPIMVGITFNGGTQGQNHLFIDGLDVGSVGIDSSQSNNGGGINAVVPNGSTYIFAGRITVWAELR